jgi:hypothetical protein
MIYIVGSDHAHQKTDVRGVWEEAAMLDAEVRAVDERAKRELREELEAIMAEDKFVCVAEEAEFNRRYIGAVLADAHGCEYLNITMPEDERRRRGIPQAYEGAQARADAYRQFEAYFFEMVQGRTKTCGDVLVICGARHAAAVAALFREAGEDVTTQIIGEIEGD